MKHRNIKIFSRAMVCGLAVAAALGWMRTAAAAEQLPENIIRLHVVANSDSPEDQQLKLEVRDAVLEEAAGWCREAGSMEQANFQLCTHLEGIASAANRVIAQRGFPQRAQAQVTEMYFPTREYEGFTLPAGRYRALQVTIGQGRGRNWWCVVFPALCLPAAAGQEEELLSGLPQAQKDVAQGRYKVGFKLAEWYEEWRERLSLGNRP